MADYADEWWPDAPARNPLPRWMGRAFLAITGIGLLGMYAAVMLALCAQTFGYVLRG